jgi:hypothetical protein
VESDELSSRVINSALKVHRQLGPGFLESVYHNALLIQLRADGMQADTEKEIRVNYTGVEVGLHRLDLVVDEPSSSNSRPSGTSRIVTWRRSSPTSRPQA